MTHPVNPQNNSASERLDSWKEIAAHLKREVRTVRRWEKTEGLPVHRHVHNRQATVYAHRHELDAWWNNRQPQLGEAEEPTSRPWRPWAGALATCALIGFASLLVWRRGNAPVPISANPAPKIRSRLFAHATGETGRIAWIPVGGHPEFALAKPDRTEVYIGTDVNVQVINTATNQVSHTIAVPNSQVMRLSQDGRTLYVGTDQGALLLIDTASWQVRSLQTGASVIRDLALTRDGEKLYLACEFAGLKQLRTRTLELSTIHSVACPMALALSPDGTRLYVNYQCEGPGGSRGHDAIDVIDVTSNRFLETITGLPNVGGRIVVSPDGSQVWANAGDACYNSAYDHLGCPAYPSSVVNVIRTSDHRLLRSLAFPVDGTGNISFFPDSARAVIGGKNLRVVDTTTLTTVEQMPLASEFVTFTPDGGRAYVRVSDKRAVAVLDLAPESCQPPPQGLASWWPGDGNANDIRAGNHANLENGATLVAGLVGQAFLLDGIDDTVRVPRMASPSSASPEITLGAWVKFRQPDRAGNSGRTSSAFILHGRPDAGAPDDGFAVYRAPDQRLVFRWGRSEVVSTIRAQAGRWWHVFAVKSGGNIAIYVNGKREGEVRLQPSPDWEFSELRIGSRVSGGFLNGLVDEVQLYRRALTDSEIAALFRAGQTGLCYQ